jgi:ubiquitin-conjugating enzyme E2 O
VQKISDTSCVGIVLVYFAFFEDIAILLKFLLFQRCWHDEDPVQPDSASIDPLLRPLQYGEVGVSFLSHNGTREILHESELCLVDRSFQLGDYCKRSLEDLRSGIITKIRVKGRLHHAISREDVPGCYVADDLKDRTEAEVGDYVAYDDWIGQVSLPFECVTFHYLLQSDH